MASGLSLEMYINIELVRIFLYNTIVFFISNRINIKKYGKSPYSFHIKFDKEFTTYNIYNNLRTTIDMPTGQVVNLLINKYLGFEAVGIYSILTKLGSVVAKVTSPISQSMLPELSRMIATRKRDIAWKLSEKMFIYINIAGLICTGVLSLFYKIWMPFFMEANIQNNIYFALYLVYLTFTSASVGIHSFFFADNYVKENLYICLGCNAIYLVLLFMTISKYGLYSVILCLLLQAIMVIVCKFLIYNKC
jgi:O-antigen/teichoic acid export membrane protein